MNTVGTENIAAALTELVGRTPLLHLQRFAADSPGRLVAKLEAWNPGGSVKDRIGLAMIEDAEQKGLLGPGSTILEATSGNTGIGLAWVAAVKGYRMIIAMPESMSVERRKVLTALGAELVLTPADEGVEGSMRQVEILARNIPGSFIPQQFANPANPAVHELTTAEEIWADTAGAVDVLVSGVGTGGTLTGAGRRLKELKPSIEVVAVEPEESPIISKGVRGPHMIQGIGAGFIPKVLDVELIDRVERVPSQEAIDAAKELAKTEGLLAGISSGAAAAAARRLARLEEYRGKTIVAILPDTGERYISTLLFYED